MTTHLRYESQTRTETDAEVIANLVRKGWEVFTTEPVVEVPPPAPTFTAEEYVNLGFSGNRPTTLLYLKLKLDAAQLVSPKLAEVQAWLDQMIVAGVTAPDERRTAEAWGASPYTFEEASGEALAVLAGQNPET